MFFFGFHGILSGNSKILTNFFQGPSDFSADVYNYLERSPDYNLTTFSLRNDADKIEILKKVKWLQPKLKIVTSPWSALPWMKEENSYCGSSLQEKYMPLYADYIIKYLQAYKGSFFLFLLLFVFFFIKKLIFFCFFSKDLGIEIDYFTVQNEPLFKTPIYPSMGMNWDQQLRFLKIMEAKMPKTLNTKCLIYDHNWGKPGEDFVTNFLKDEWAYSSPFIDGVRFFLFESFLKEFLILFTMNEDCLAWI